jgi:putative addiction module component (TIGR02574 family)
MPHISDFSHLTLPERLHLVHDLWESIHDEACAVPIPPEQRAEAERRDAELASGRVQGIPLETMRQSLLRRR